MIVTLSSGNNVTIESYTYDYEGNRISKQLNEDGKIYYLNDTFQYLTQVALELKKQEDGTYGINKYYTRGTELIKADIYGEANAMVTAGMTAETSQEAAANALTEGISEVAGEMVSANEVQVQSTEENSTCITKQYIMDGHGSVTALAETNETGNVVTDTYTYDAYGTLLKKTGTTDNDYLYTGEQYNEATGLYYLRARYMNPETGTFISMDSYAGSLDNPASLHKYLYANANPVMYTDPTGYFSLAESSVAQACRSAMHTAYIAPLKILHKTMQWANIVVTMYDAMEEYEKLQSGESTIEDLAFVILKGIGINCLLQCLFGSEVASLILKVANLKASTNSLKEALESRDPQKIYVEILRVMVALYSFHCECFTGETLVSTTEGDKRIDEIKVGDYVYAYDTEKEENVPAKVTYVSVTETNILVHVYTSEGEEIKTTMLHPFYVKNVKNGTDEEYGMWKASANLVAGDELLTDDGRIVYVEEVRIERLAESIKVYNLEVEGLHTYYVGSGVHTYYVGSGVLVHNNYAKGNDSNGNSNESGSGTKDIYRAVSPEEYDDIFSTNSFRGRTDGMSFQAKEFGNSFDETLEFANKSINSDKAAIIKVTIPEEIYNQLNHMNLDSSIFKSGTPVVEPEMLDLFNKSIIKIEHAY